jgi:hypothetical protein
MGFWRMKSVLPPVLELKRLRIAKKHNRLAATVLSIVLGLALIFILSGLRGHLLARSQVVVALLIVGTAEAYSDPSVRQGNVQATWLYVPALSSASLRSREFHQYEWQVSEVPEEHSALRTAIEHTQT